MERSAWHARCGRSRIAGIEGGNERGLAKAKRHSLQALGEHTPTQNDKVLSATAVRCLCASEGWKAGTGIVTFMLIATHRRDTQVSRCQAQIEGPLVASSGTGHATRACASGCRMNAGLAGSGARELISGRQHGLP